jgi:hypothetical protein
VVIPSYSIRRGVALLPDDYSSDLRSDGVAAGLMVDGVNEVLSVEDDQVDRVTTAREDVFPGSPRSPTASSF